MYAVSQDYIDELENNAVHFERISGTIGSVPFTDANILKGSLTITNQCSDQKNIGIGQVYIGSLKCTFMGINLGSAETWIGKVISLTHYLTIGQSEEGVPLGYYTVASANQTASGIVVTAYDNMSLLDQRVSSSLLSGYNTAEQWLQVAATACGITIGNTSGELAAMTNGTVLFKCSRDGDISSWRDFLADISQALCAFATAGRDGKIYLRQYKQLADETLTPDRRVNDGAYSDFTSYYSSIYFDNLDGSESGYSIVGDGLVYEGGKNAFLLEDPQGEDLDDIRQAVMNKLGEINFYPFSVSVAPEPYYDLGDVIDFSGGIAGSGKHCVITKINFKHHSKLKLTGVGTNPRLANVKSREEKKIAAMQREQTAAMQQAKQETQEKIDEITYDYVEPQVKRTDPITDGNDAIVMEIYFVLGKAGKVRFATTVNLDAVADTPGDQTHLHVTYGIDGTQQTALVEYYEDGHHILTLDKLTSQLSAGSHVFAVAFGVTGGTVS